MSTPSPSPRHDPSDPIPTSAPPRLDPGFEALRQACIVVDARGQVQAANRAARELLGADVLASPIATWPERLQLRDGDGQPVTAAALPFVGAADAADGDPVERTYRFTPPGEPIGGEGSGGEGNGGERNGGERNGGPDTASEGRAPRTIATWTQAWPLDDGAATGTLTLLRPDDRRWVIAAAQRERAVDLERRHVRQVALARAGAAIGEPHELAPLLRQLLERTRADLPSWAAAIALFDAPDALGDEPAVAAAHPPTDAPADAASDGPAGTSSHAPTGTPTDAPTDTPPVSPTDPDASPVFAAIVGLDRDADRQGAEAIHRSGAGDWVRREARPLTVERPELDPFAEPGGSAGPIRAWAAIPLQDGGQPLGVLYAFDRAPRRLDSDDLLYLRELARRAGAAIAKVALIDRLRRQAAELETHRDHLEDLVAERTAELEASHARLRTADRLAAIGTFTAGLGHDMNNVLFPLRCRLDAIDDTSLGGNGAVGETIQAARRTVDFLQELSDGLRHLARDPVGADPTPVELAPWWTRVQPLLRHAVPESITVHATVPDDLPPVLVTPAGLTQAVLNLFVNAADAMPDGGTVHLTIERDDPRPRSTDTAPPDDDGTPATDVRLTVRDDGPGMTPEVAAQVFDPFFSTRTRTVSTGLGLWLVHSVVERAGGRITLDTEPGRGTAISLHLRAGGPAPATGAVLGGPCVVRLDDPRQRAWIDAAVDDIIGDGTIDDLDEARDRAEELVGAIVDAAHAEDATMLRGLRPDLPVIHLGPVAARPASPASPESRAADASAPVPNTDTPTAPDAESAPDSTPAPPFDVVADPMDLPAIRARLERLVHLDRREPPGPEPV